MRKRKTVDSKIHWPLFCQMPGAERKNDPIHGLTLLSTGVDLQDRHFGGFGYSDPNVLYDSIQDYNNR